MRKPILKALSILLLAMIVTSCGKGASHELAAEYKKGEIISVEDVYGVFFVYVPLSMSPNPDLLVLVHGTPAETWSVEETAKYYIDHWINFAEEEGVVLIAPSFSDENFSSRKGEIEDKMTGYRGLFGREIGTDEG